MCSHFGSKNPAILPSPHHSSTDRPTNKTSLAAVRSCRTDSKVDSLTRKFDLDNHPKPTVKVQVLADFVVECTLLDDPPTKLNPKEDAEDQSWTLHVDGSSTSRDSGAGLILANPDGVVAEQPLCFKLSASNNEVEYKALIAGLKLAKKLKVDHLKALSDSQLIVSQIPGDFEAKEPTMQMYLQNVRSITSTLGTFEIQHILKSENTRADLLSKLATLRSSDLLKIMFLEYLKIRSTEEPEPALYSECAAQNHHNLCLASTLPVAFNS